MRSLLVAVRDLATLAVAAPLLPVVGLMWLAVAMTPTSAEGETAPADPRGDMGRSRISVIRRRPVRSGCGRVTPGVALAK
jgi:hypothetical protein